MNYSDPHGDNGTRTPSFDAHKMPNAKCNWPSPMIFFSHWALLAGRFFHCLTISPLIQLCHCCLLLLSSSPNTHTHTHTQMELFLWPQLSSICYIYPSCTKEHAIAFQRAKVKVVGVAAIQIMTLNLGYLSSARPLIRTAQNWAVKCMTINNQIHTHTHKMNSHELNKCLLWAHLHLKDKHTWQTLTVGEEDSFWSFLD